MSKDKEKDHPSPIGPKYEQIKTIWLCLCTILQQMADSSAKKCQIRRKVSQAQLAPYMDIYMKYGHVYVQFYNKWQTLVQKFSNEEKYQLGPSSPIYGHMCTIWLCLCTILQQMEDSSAKKCQMGRKVIQA